MSFTFVIKNASIVDGTGHPAFVGDVGIDGDRIVRVGRIHDAGGARVIDATGLVLSPGFIDAHTHYDPQLCWDGLATPSLEHGTTTVAIGNCSFTLAPIKPEYQQAVSELFIKAEDMTQSYFDKAVPYSWSSVEEYLAFIKPRLGINVAPLASHTLIRHFVMGADAQQRTATPDEVTAMCDLLREICRSGAVGMSMSYADTDMNNMPIACRWSDIDEKKALARVLSEEGKGYVQVDLEFLDKEKMFKQLVEMGDISLDAGVTCAALGVFESPLDRTLHRRLMFAVEEQNLRGARVLLQTSTRPFDWSYSLAKTFFMFFLLPSWNEIVQGDKAQRIAAYTDWSRRAALNAELQEILPLMAGTHVMEVHSETNRKYVGRRVIDIAREQGRTFTDVLLEIALADELETQFEIKDVSHADVNAVAEILHHPLVQIGGADSGAHLTQFCGAGDTTWMLEYWVRRTGKFTLEQAVKRMTSDLARDLNIADRGVIQVGKFADLVLFDREKVARGEQYFSNDLPDGSGRFMWRAKGIHSVLVNGQPVYENGAYTDARNGTIV